MEGIFSIFFISDYKILNSCVEEDLLYGDLDETAKSAEVFKLREAFSKEKRKNELLMDECNQLRTQINCLVEDRKQLETNMVSMYNTAMLELKRKDRDISDLRFEIRRLQS